MVQNKKGKEKERDLQMPTSAVWSLDNLPQADVSIFKNVYCVEPCGTVNLFSFLLCDDYRQLVEAYRTTALIDKKKEIKAKKLPCVTVAGVFDTRSKMRLEHQHSGYICIDIDGKQNPRVKRRWQLTKKMLGKLFNSLCYAGLSVGGNGLCLIFKIAYPHYHKMHFYALVDEIKARTGLVVDESGSDVVRLRVASYDETPFFNPDAEPYVHIKRNKNFAARKYPKYRTAEHTNIINARVKCIMNKIREKRIDITKGRNAWIRIGQALANEYGHEMGRDLFHSVSMYHPEYDIKECDSAFEWCICHCRKTHIATFFYYCKKYGLRFK